MLRRYAPQVMRRAMPRVPVITGVSVSLASMMSAPRALALTAGRASTPPPPPPPHYHHHASMDDASPHALSHFFVPEDANLAGNVHGGTILKLVEKAGWVASQRHCTTNGDFVRAPACVTARLDTMSFLKPIHIGNLGHFDAKVTYTSPHTMRVEVDVYAEDLESGTTVLANRASVWYVAMEKVVPTGPAFGVPILGAAAPVASYRIAKIPQLKPESDRDMAKFEEGHQLYVQRQEGAEARRRDLAASVDSESWAPPRAPGAAQPAGSVCAATSQLVQLMGPAVCVSFDPNAPVAGGGIMKLMDEAAGISAAKHCHTNVVTASLDAMDFMVPIYNGNLVTVTARPVFSSRKSLEVEVVVETEDFTRGRIPAIHALFTFVSLGADGSAQDMPALVTTSTLERQRFEQGKHRYEARKAARAAAKERGAARGAAGAGAAGPDGVPARLVDDTAAKP